MTSIPQKTNPASPASIRGILFLITQKESKNGQS